MSKTSSREVPADHGFETMDFSHYLRTGRRRRIASPDHAAPELKFNPWHDPDNGQFTFGPGGARHPAGAIHSDKRVSRAAPVAPAKDTAKARPSRELGILSEKHESRGDPGVISTGRDDKGGASYGSYQFATKVGALQEFLASPDAQPWTDEFRGLTPATPEFDKTWKKIAAREPARFHAAQKRYVQRVYFDASAKMILTKMGYDVSRASNAVQQVLWSTSVQHGAHGGAKIVVASIKEADMRVGRGASSHERVLINLIYNRRIASFKAQAERYRGQGLLDKYRFSTNVYAIRLPEERTDALNMLDHDLER